MMGQESKDIKRVRPKELNGDGNKQVLAIQGEGGKRKNGCCDWDSESRRGKLGN